MLVSTHQMPILPFPAVTTKTLSMHSQTSPGDKATTPSHCPSRRCQGPLRGALWAKMLTPYQPTHQQKTISMDTAMRFQPQEMRSVASYLCRRRLKVSPDWLLSSVPLCHPQCLKRRPESHLPKAWLPRAPKGPACGQNPRSILGSLDFRLVLAFGRIIRGQTEGSQPMHTATYLACPGHTKGSCANIYTHCKHSSLVHRVHLLTRVTDKLW